MRRTIAVVVVALALCLPFAACDSGSGSGLTGGLSAATTVSAVGINPTTVQIFWTDTNALESGYKIERTGSPFSVIATVGPDTETFIDTGLEPRKSYQYRIRAFSGGVFSPYSAIVTVTPPFPPAPSIASISPDAAFVGSSVHLAGSGFDDYSPGPNTVLFGGAASPAVTVVDDDNLACEVPAPAAGRVDVTVANLNGGATLTDSFTVFDYPVVFPTTETTIEGGPLQNSRSPEVCCEGANVYASWSTASELYFSRSADAGVTWSPPFRLDTGPTLVLGEPAIHCEGPNVYVVWTNASFGTDVNINRSFDGGLSWQGQTRVGSTPLTALAAFASIASDGNNLYVVYVDTQFGNIHLVLARSTDAGATWEPGVRLDGGCDATFAFWRDIAVFGRNVHVAFIGACGGRAYVMTNSSTDGGASWWPQSVRADTSAAGPTFPVIASWDNQVYVAWNDLRNGANDVYFNRSTNAGASFEADDQPLESSPRGSGPPQICATEDYVHVAWALDTAEYVRSNDGGVTFSRPAGIASGASPARDVRLSCEGDLVFGTWNLGGNIFTNVSIDGGASFQTTQTPVSFSAGTVNSPGELCTAGPRAYVLFSTTSGDIYANHSTPQ